MRPWWGRHTAGAGRTREAEHAAGGPSPALSAVGPVCRAVETLGKERLVGVQRGLGKRCAGDTEALGGRRQQPQSARGRRTAPAQRPRLLCLPRGHDHRLGAWHPGFPSGEARSSVPPCTSVQVGGWLPQSEGLLGARERAAVPRSVLTQLCPPRRRARTSENPGIPAAHT